MAKKEKWLIQPLYKTDQSELITVESFFNALNELSIKKGDTLFVHSDIRVFGKLVSFDRKLLLSSFVNILKEIVGPQGNIIVPTFTYSFCKNEIFDVINSPSSVGTLSEYFRLQPAVIRSMHPLFSVALWGKDKKLLQSVGSDCFNELSIFGLLHKIKGKILFLGAPFHSCTYIHYVEQMHGIPYRYFKTFKGQVRNQSGEITDEVVTFFVRDLKNDVTLNLEPFKQYLLEKKIMTKTAVGHGEILTVTAKDLFDEGCQMLDQNISFFLKDPYVEHH